MKVIDFENHFFTAAYLEYIRNRNTPPKETIDTKGPEMWYDDTMCSPRSFEIDNKMADLGEGRLRDMEEGGIDIEILSLSPPGVQCFDPDDGTSWARKTNNELALLVKKHPDRFIGLACVAPQNPGEAADEVERSATELGLKGIILHSHAREEYLDDKKYWVIFERAAQLDMPVYIHPALPSTLILPGYSTYGFDLAGPVLGFAADVALHSMRLIFSGLFDRYPELNVILGHLGEGLPFWLDRIDLISVRDWKRSKIKIEKKPSEYIKKNFTILTSGMHFLPAFMCAYMSLGADRIAFGTDYPYAGFKKAVDFVKEAPISEADKEKIFYSNTAKLFKM